uniref:Uncharacterized protein n=1 Tax=viral metagenome TaxID=1070528 RepID=A0A6C0EBA2_9ZZZZ
MQKADTKPVIKNGRIVLPSISKLEYNINQVYEGYGFTILHMAILNGDDDIVREILLKDPDLTVVDYFGRTAEQYAVLTNNFKVLGMLDLHKVKHVRSELNELKRKRDNLEDNNRFLKHQNLEINKELTTAKADATKFMKRYETLKQTQKVSQKD